MSEAASTKTMDLLAAALNRASGVLDSVNNLYAVDQDIFHGGNAFAAHAISTTQGLLNEALVALTELYGVQAEQAAHVRDLETELESLAHTIDAQREQVQQPIQQGEVESGAVMTDTHLEEVLSWPGADNSVDEADLAEESFAENYEALLRKVTAVEVFANTQDPSALPQIQQELLPLVRSLKDDLLKLNRVA